LGHRPKVTEMKENEGFYGQSVMQRHAISGPKNRLLELEARFPVDAIQSSCISHFVLDRASPTRFHPSHDAVASISVVRFGCLFRPPSTLVYARDGGARSTEPHRRLALDSRLRSPLL
jgi:hypothetical protein